MRTTASYAIGFSMTPHASCIQDLKRALVGSCVPGDAVTLYGVIRCMPTSGTQFWDKRWKLLQVSQPRLRWRVKGLADVALELLWLQSCSKRIPKRHWIDVRLLSAESKSSGSGSLRTCYRQYCDREGERATKLPELAFDAELSCSWVHIQGSSWKLEQVHV